MSSNSSQHSRSSAGRSDTVRWLAVLLMLATVAVFSRSVGHDFVEFDDPDYTTNNRYVRDGLSWTGLRWAFTSTELHNWQPLIWLSHMLDAELYGLNPHPRHLTNVLLHTANTLALFLVLCAMTGASWRSAFVAALFALHPLHVESVAWISGRTDLLGTFFWLLTMAVYLRHARQPSFSRSALVALVFALAVMAKQMVVTLPFVLLLLDYWPLGRWPDGPPSARKDVAFVRGPRGWDLLLEKLPLLLIAAGGTAVAVLAKSRFGAIQSLEAIPFGARLANALLAYVAYLGKTIWPTGLAVFYPHPGTNLPVGQVAGAALLLTVVTTAAYFARRRWPYLIVGWLWYLGTLVPVIGVVQVGLQAMADRYTYLPLIGIFLLVAWGAGDLVTAWARRRGLDTQSARWQPWQKLVAGIACGVLAVLAMRSWLQLAHWRNSITLLQHALEVTDNNDIVHYNLARILARDPDNIPEAIGHYKEAVRIKPDFVAARVNLGATLAQIGEIDEAVDQFIEAVRHKPSDPLSHYNLALALTEKGRFDWAIAEYRTALQLNRNYADAHHNLAMLLERIGRAEEAVDHYRRALQLRPGTFQPMLRLAWILATHPEMRLRDFAEALRLANYASRLTGNRDPRALDTLAAALANAGRFEQATATADRAAYLASRAGRRKLALEIRRRKRLYEVGQPYRDQQLIRSAQNDKT